MKLQHISAHAAILAPVAVAATAAPGVVPISISKGTNRRALPIRRRADTYSQTLTNNISYGGYFASVEVGTPGQTQDMVLDTGSSDTWFLGSDSSTCAGEETSSSGGGFGRRQTSTSACISTFDTSSSSTFSNLSTAFSIEYVDGSGTDGYYFTDTLTIAGASVTDLQMGLAETSDLTYGIMGIGFAADEAAQTLYPNIIDKFYTEDLIGSRAYSLFLDDLDSSTGSILFGGVDSDKYSGDLIAVPIIKDAAYNNYTSFTVTLSSVAAMYSNGSLAENFTTSSDPTAVVLDSGTTLTYLPEDIGETVLEAFGATYDNEAGYATVDCSLADETDLILAFQFGGSDGPTIQVDMSELVIQDGSDIGFSPGGGGGQTTTCAFGVSMSSSTFLLGDTFLRSAYVVYDLDTKVVALAQSNTNSTSSSVTAITSGSAIPGVSSTASAVMASSTSTAVGTTDSGHKSAAMALNIVPLASVGVGAIIGALLVFF